MVNCLEGEVDVLKAVWDIGGSLKAIKTSPSIALPRDPEELRQRVALLGRAWAFVGLGQPNCKYLQGGTPQMWSECLDYLLGPHVHRLYTRDAYGAVSSEPPWNLLLSYELEIRRKTVELMAKGSSIDFALPAAYKDGLIKERYFITPLAVGATLMRTAANTSLPTNKQKRLKEYQDRKGKGNERGKVRTARGRGTKQGRLPPQTERGSASVSIQKTKDAQGLNAGSCVCARNAIRTTRRGSAPPEGDAGPGTLARPRQCHRAGTRQLRGQVTRHPRR